MARHDLRFAEGVQDLVRAPGLRYWDHRGMHLDYSRLLQAGWPWSCGERRAGRGSPGSHLDRQGNGGRKARNLEEGRKRRQILTRKGHKKAEPTKLSTVQALTLKKITTHPEHPRARKHDLLLTARDALLMGLLVRRELPEAARQLRKMMITRHNPPFSLYPSLKYL